MRIAAAKRDEQVLQCHPAAFLDAVSTVAALGRQVRQLQQQVAALQSQQPAGSGGDSVELTLFTDDAAAVDRLLQVLRPALRVGATVRLRLRGQAATRDSLEIASTAATWLRDNDFENVHINADTTSPTVTVSGRLAA